MRYLWRQRITSIASIEFKRELGIAVYSYCLMTNHIHLIVNPGAGRDSIGLLMKRLAGRQTRYVNKLETKQDTHPYTEK